MVHMTKYGHTTSSAHKIIINEEYDTFSVIFFNQLSWHDLNSNNNKILFIIF